MNSIILTILSCLIIILLFNKLFNTTSESFDLPSDLTDEKNEFDKSEEDSSGSGSSRRGTGDNEETGIIAAPNTTNEGDIIDTISRISIKRMCNSSDCKDREIRWGNPDKGDLSIIPKTFEKIISKLNI